MGSRLKEDEKNERSIRALLKQSENRRCINCGSLGPQYVCTTFSIFVCTNCSGLHREFTHRIKSVSMAKFTADEVRNLQAGGNERGREIFFKDFDFSRNSLPDSSNAEKLRDFIKVVYVDRRYTGERALPPKGRPGDREDSYGRPDPRSSPRDFRAGNDTRSPSYEDRYDDRRFVERRRSDADRGRYEDRRYEDRVVRFEEKRSPGRLDPDPRARYNRGQYDDRQHDDRSRYEERDRDRRNSYDDRFANESRHDRRRSADDRNSKDFEGDSPPVRPVSEILGDNIPTLRVEEYRHTNGRDSRDGRDDDDRSSLGSPASVSNSDNRRDIRIPRLGSFGSANGSSNSLNSASIKRESSGSLIDFSAEPEPAAAPAPAASAAVRAAPVDPFGVSTAAAPAAQPSAVSSSSTGWAVFDLAPAAPAAAEAPPAGYPDVFGPSASGGQWNASGWPSTQPAAAAAAAATDNWASLMGPSVQPQGAPPASQQWNSFSPVNKAPATQQQPQSQIPPQGQPQQGVPSVQQVQTQSSLLQEQPNTSAGLSAAPNVDRSRELPKELFASPFPSAGGLGMGQHIPGFPPPGMPYNPMVSMPVYAQPPRSRNPFDLPADAAPAGGGSTFPGMGSLQAALPTGPLSVPGSAAPTMFNQWSLGPQHASYPQGVSAGGNAFAPLSANFGAQTGMPAHSLGPTLGLSNSGNYNNMPLFGAGTSFLGAGMSDFTAQNSVRPVGGNPFG